jgi:hypothetical protein
MPLINRTGRKKGHCSVLRNFEGIAVPKFLNRPLWLLIVGARLFVPLTSLKEREPFGWTRTFSFSTILLRPATRGSLVLCLKSETLEGTPHWNIVGLCRSHHADRNIDTPRDSERASLAYYIRSGLCKLAKLARRDSHL